MSTQAGTKSAMKRNAPPGPSTRARATSALSQSASGRNAKHSTPASTSPRASQSRQRFNPLARVSAARQDLVAHERLHATHDALDREAQLLVQHAGRGRAAEAVEP